MTLVVLSAALAPRYADAVQGRTDIICDDRGHPRMVLGDRATLRQINFFLFDAAARGHARIVSALIAAGADTDRQDSAGNTALAPAAEDDVKQAMAAGR